MLTYDCSSHDPTHRVLNENVLFPFFAKIHISSISDLNCGALATFKICLLCLLLVPPNFEDRLNLCLLQVSPAVPAFRLAFNDCSSRILVSAWSSSKYLLQFCYEVSRIFLPPPFCLSFSVLINNFFSFKVCL